MNCNLNWFEDLVQDPTFMFPLVFSHTNHLFIVVSFYVFRAILFYDIFPRELYWSQLRPCNPHLIHLVSPPSEIFLVLDLLIP